MSPLVTPDEILSIYQFDFGYFYGFALASFAAGIVGLLAILFVVCMAIQDEAKVKKIGGMLTRKGVVAVVALALIGAFFYQNWQRHEFADSLAQGVANQETVYCGLPDSNGHTLVQVSGEHFRVPDSKIVRLQEELLAPRKIPFASEKQDD